MNRNMKTLAPVCPTCKERGHIVPEDSFSTLHEESANVARLTVQWFYYCKECGGTITRTVETFVPLAIVEVMYEEPMEEEDDSVEVEDMVTAGEEMTATELHERFKATHRAPKYAEEDVLLLVNGQFKAINAIGEINGKITIQAGKQETIYLNPTAKVTAIF